MATPLLTIATAGSVDDGKSTLIGRLLYETDSLSLDRIAQVESASRRAGQYAGHYATCCERQRGLGRDGVVRADCRVPDRDGSRSVRRRDARARL